MTTVEAEFYFSPQKTPILVFAPMGLRYASVPTPTPFEDAVRVFCFHGTRAFVNTRHAETIQRLGRSMWLDWCLDSILREPLDLAAQPALSKRVVQLRARIDSKGQSEFWMGLKGLGFFGEGSTAGCLASFLVHYVYLSRLWQHNKEFSRRLEIAAAEIRWGADKDASILTQVPFAKKAAERALTEELK